MWLERPRIQTECSSNTQNVLRMYLECNTNRFRQQSRCIRGAVRLIRGAFGTFWQDLKWLGVSILPRMRSECFECCWNVLIIFKMQSECSQNTLRMPFDISPLRMHLEGFEHEQNIRTGHKNGLEYLECTQNAVRSFRTTSNIQKYTKNVHSDGIPAHSASSVTRV